MNETNSQALLQILSELVELSPDVRFGQLLANLGFLTEARAGEFLWDLEDPRLLRVMEEHRGELTERLEPSSVRRST